MNVESKKYFDAAIIISIITSMLYIFGWTYWDSYYKYFGINHQLIDIDFYQIISSTWLYILAVIFALHWFLGFEFIEANSIDDMKVSYNNAWQLLILICFILSINVFSFKWYIHIPLALLLMVASHFAVVKFEKKYFFFGKAFFKSRLTKYLTLIIFFLVTLMFYNYLGEYHANKLANGNFGNKIAITTIENIEIPTPVYFIAYSKNKYFVCYRVLKSNELKVVAIDNSLIKNVEFIK